MRILHTSDWHLGHTMQGLPRDHEHTAFLKWLRQVLLDQRIDVLLLSGDVFHTANPSAQATSTWYGFLSEVVGDNKSLQVVVIAGNHDSPARLQAPHPILSPMRVHVVGQLRGTGGELDMDRLVIPLKDHDGAVRAVCAAVPFLRPEDLGTGLEVASDRDHLVDGVRAVYAQVLAAARKGHGGQRLPIVALGHCYMTGATLSEFSERKVLGGNQHALPLDIFPEDVAYVALGHLHLAQPVGGRANVRYAGSPIPLSLAEAPYRHQVCVVELSQAAAPRIDCLHVPRAVDIVRVPTAGAAPLPWVLERLRKLPPRDEYLNDNTRPYLEVAVKLDSSPGDPELRARVEEALAGRAPPLIKLSVVRPLRERTLADVAPVETLHDLTPDQVFRSLYRKASADADADADGDRDSDGDGDGKGDGKGEGEGAAEPGNEAEPPPALLAAFHELVDAVSQGGPEGGKRA